MIKVLVVDDSALVRKLFGKVLSAESDIEVQFARDGLDALKQLSSFEPDVITLDVQMPHMNGLQCLDRIMIERPCPVVMVSSMTEAGAATALEALRLGAVDCMPKPDGAISLSIAAFAPLLVEKVRIAATVRLKASRRLRERIQHRMGNVTPRSTAARGERRAPPCMSGQGLVLIGTSTGGPPALEIVLSALPVSFPWPVMVAQHMPFSFTGPFARRLDRQCAVSVVEATDPVPLKPGHVYIGRGDADLIVTRHGRDLMAESASALLDYPWHPSVDRLVQSAMEQIAPAQLIGVLMTGMGNDGAARMTELRARGGKTIAESEESAVIWGMPGELVKMDGADFILPLKAISEQLERLVPANAPGANQCL